MSIQKKNNIKVAIFSSRIRNWLSEETITKPKSLIKIGVKQILVNIIIRELHTWNLKSW